VAKSLVPSFFLIWPNVRCHIFLSRIVVMHLVHCRCCGAALKQDKSHSLNSHNSYDIICQQLHTISSRTKHDRINDGSINSDTKYAQMKMMQKQQRQTEASISPRLGRGTHSGQSTLPPTTVLLSCHVLLRTACLLYGMKS